MKPLLLTSLAALALGSSAHAALITEPIRTFVVGTDLADVTDPPMSLLQTIMDSAILSLTEVRVGLNLVGLEEGSGFASEMFVSLNKDLSVTSVLLNQVGRTDGDPLGFGYNGWNVAFRDGATGGDVHEASLVSGVLTGEFEPDGRANATGVLRPLLLNVFNSGPGNGDWRLSIGDLEAGGTMRIESWSLTLTGDTEVPEAGTWAAVVTLGIILAFRALPDLATRARR